jgi:hypothetical protein
MSQPNPPRSAAPRSGYAQLLFLIGVLVSGGGLFIADPALRQAVLWGGALIAGAGLLIQPTRSAAELRLRVLLGLAMLLILARVITAYRAFDIALIAVAVLIGALAAYMRYGPGRKP